MTVKQLTRYIKMKIDSDSTLSDVWVQGEISNFTRHSSGHLYFTLKDKDSRVKAIMFQSYAQSLSFLPNNGTKVLARGHVSVYERDGQYQFYVNQMQPDGIGSLYLAYEQLKKKLEQEGLFAAERKRPLPKFPRTIGVITSPTGAAVRDIITTLHRRYPQAEILLYPVSVQGKQAAPSIVKAINQMNRMAEAEVLIAGRGGGSLEELWAFNEEIVARSIAESRIPVISAVGHETDFTIADFVADVRAATPTAAAELAVPNTAELIGHIGHLKQRLDKALSAVYVDPAQRLDRMRLRLTTSMTNRIDSGQNRIMRLSHRIMMQRPQEKVKAYRRQWENSQGRLHAAIDYVMKQSKMQFASTIRQLDALSPLKVMQRGYSLTYDEQKKQVVRSVHQVQLGDRIFVKLPDGQLDCQVWSIEGGNDDGE